jgi:glycosyltransferase involved in cell wall biosynthesis
MADRVCAVVITYFPDAGFPERLEKIAAQVSRVIVVDNGTTGQSGMNLEKALGATERVSCIRNGENLGVAAALNQGIRRALAEEPAGRGDGGKDAGGLEIPSPSGKVDGRRSPNGLRGQHLPS